MVKPAPKSTQLQTTQEDDRVISEISKDDFRSLFYLFAGKPDSRIKVFYDSISITSADIIELNDCIARKLVTHHIEHQVTTVKVSYSGSLTDEFGTWAEFSSHHWSQPERVEEIVVKWDFLVKIENFRTPQRHTLMVRISSDIKPSKLLQMMVSNNVDELDQMDVMVAPAFCRVDFINAQISKELINEVSDWYKSRTKPSLTPEIFRTLRKNSRLIATAFEQWLLFSWAVLVCAVCLWTDTRYLNSHMTVDASVILIIIGLYSFQPISKLASFMGSRTSAILNDMEGSRVLFNFTSGDRKRISEIQAENKKKGRRFIFQSLWNIGLNLIASLIFTYLFQTSLAH